MPWLTVSPYNTISMSEINVYRDREKRNAMNLLPGNVFFLGTHVQPITVFQTFTNVPFPHKCHFPKEQRSDSSKTAMFWGKWCFVKIQRHYLKMFSFAAEEKTTKIQNWTCFYYYKKGADKGLTITRGALFLYVYYFFICKRYLEPWNNTAMPGCSRGTWVKQPNVTLSYKAPCCTPGSNMLHPKP